MKLADISPTTLTRRPKAYSYTYNISLIHLRNPWVTAWWSASFPGFGHIFLGSYIKGFMLVFWEIIINTTSHLNLAIYYTFTGQFQAATQTLDQRWLLLYIGAYIYAIWDGFRSTIELNKCAILGEREGAQLLPARMGAFEINIMSKRIPLLAAFWSATMPGLGHLYTHRLPSGFFFFIWWVVICYQSHVLPGIHLTLTGDFAAVAQAVDVQWLLYLPSLYLFAAYSAYNHTVEFNKLFDAEQANYLQRRYQDSRFELPV
ncbi:hypothetical protein [Sporomusa termitida]|uniref:TM2 domain protein n=1 Tax=Sporomusa termitida TaxID=2377 RepID=A0A517DP96_9FIRM|nr:hypothetical protein [Sporomusa termitida]QDR79184.1 hypothetical protein SPTER_04520 [Sporomusa termitida]